MKFFGGVFYVDDYVIQIVTWWNIDPPIKKEYYFKSFVVITLKFLTVIKNYASYYLKKNLALDT